MSRPGKTWRYDYYAQTWGGLTWETLKAFKAAEKEWIAEQFSVILARRAKAHEAVKALAQTGFFKPKVGRAYLTMTVMKFYDGDSTPGQMSTTTEEEWLTKRDTLAQDTVTRAAAASNRDQAVCWLLAKGKHYGADFTIETAVAVADNLAFDMRCTELAPPVWYAELGCPGPESGVPSVWRAFDGQNCEGPCLGWDGRSHRCQCGNRRVQWTAGSSHTFREPSVFAEAY